jgi:hypothetical protein
VIRPPLCILLAGVGVFCTAGSAVSQTPATAPALPVILGPAAPQAPEVVTRDAAGNATVRATRLAAPIRVDGRLDEAVYTEVKAVSGLVQNIPRPGEPSSEKTDIWVFFDDAAFYVSARCWDADGPGALIANEMRRDNGQITNNDSFGVIIDTFYDRRNAFMFITNPLAAQRDIQVTNEGNSNQDWNPVWMVRSQIFDGGWTTEIRIPFKSIRYRPKKAQIWGINFRRGIRRKNEYSNLTPLPAADGSGAWIRMSRAGTLVGLEAASEGRNLDIKPYAIAGIRSDNTVRPVVDGAVDRKAGVDVKLGLTKGTTLDVSLNTDFAQVEVDEQQVNLTRFNLFFPEKREFFLEGRGIFEFGRPNFTRGSVPTGGIVPELFFTRQIGLNRGRVVPIIVGGRVTGRIGNTTIGALNMETDAEPASATPKTNFTVLRVRQDILKRSSIGAMFTGRSASLRAPGHANVVLGVDGAFSFINYLNLNGFYMQSTTPGLAGSEASYHGRAEWNADRYGFELNHLFVGDAFNPEVGFVQRPDIRRTVGSARFSPRVRRVPSVRQVFIEGTAEFIENTAGQLITRVEEASFSTEFHRSDRVFATASRTFDRLLVPFRLAGGPTIPVGDYDFYKVSGGYGFGSQRRVSGSVSAGWGRYYDGDQTTVTVSGGRVQVSPQFSIEPTLALNWFSFPATDYRTRVARARINYTFTPRMFVSGLVQYNSTANSLTSNIRLRWEYIPGSELFVVYTDENTADLPHRSTAPRLLNRGFVVKVNRLLRY